MKERILKQNAIEIIEDIVRKNPGCTKLFIYDKYKELGGTYYIDGRNEPFSYNFGNLISTLVRVKRFLKRDEKYYFHN